MLFLPPLLFIIFILLLVLKLLGYAISWEWVALPAVLMIIAIVVYVLHWQQLKRRRRKSGKDQHEH